MHYYIESLIDYCVRYIKKIILHKRAWLPRLCSTSLDLNLRSLVRFFQNNFLNILKKTFDFLRTLGFKDTGNK